MKKVSFILVSATLLGTALAATTVHAADEANYNSNGVITYAPSEDQTNPVDPLNPDKPVTPNDPTNPDGKPNPGTNGPLSIDFASSLIFGEQKITSTTETYHAQAQGYTDASGNAQEGPNYVQVSDNRGKETGWTLKVKQDNQFKTASAKELTGAKITLANGNVVSNSSSAKPTAVTPITLNPGTEATVMSAANGQGAGTYLTDWGTDLDSAKQSISLEVPGSTTKYADSYTTTFTWNLTDVPGNK
ncbi:WxL domain-containing protein [Enterococcus sp. 22-H-5-01]|uniref:WxL domain-containing protein n=1 Tax=Enterococcus sp. 22-H-5-01 TaxID=3418555 RepID=UPI003D0851A6